MTGLTPPVNSALIDGDIGLADLPRGTIARVVSVYAADAAAPEELARRLAELGFLPGEAVRVVARGLLAREPIAVRIGTNANRAMIHGNELNGNKIENNASERVLFNDNQQ